MTIGLNESYLGDGVYASSDGYHIVIRAGMNVIYLDDMVIESLVNYIKREKQIKSMPKDTKGEGVIGGFEL